MQPARLKLYYNYLGNFDFIDKELQYSKFLIVVPKLDTLSINSKLNSCQLDKNIVIKGLILEIFGNQRFLMEKTEKMFFKSLRFKSALRKENLFLFLDICLNTIFLYDHKFLTLDNARLENKLYFYLNNDFMNHLTLTSSKLKYSIQVFKQDASLKNSLDSWFFYPTFYRQ